MSQLVRTALSGNALRIILSNPTRRNPLSSAALNQLETAFKESHNPEVRAIVISSEGPVFSAGHDLKEIRAMSPDEQYQLFDKCGKIMLAIQDLPVPVIAQVEGLAAAAGCQLVAACDMALGGPDSKYSLPGASVGLFCSAPSVPVIRNIPKKVAAYLLYSGKPINADEALKFGLISHKADSSEALENFTQQIVDDISSKSRHVIKLGKLFLKTQRSGEAEDYANAAKVMAHNLTLHDGKEGLCAFTEKRHPKWQN